SFHWRICYFIGGGLGFCLLILRISVMESGMYNKVKEMSSVAKGDFRMFFNNGARMRKYLLAILIGLPTWYVIGVLVTFSNNFAKEFNVSETIDPGRATMYAYVAISIGDVLVGFVSQWLKSRKKALFLFYGLTVMAIGLYFTQDGGSASRMYAICAALGFGTGFWAIFVTMAAEQFGTNLRATAATTVPNMVRGALPLILLLFNWLQHFTSYVNAGLITGGIVMLISIIAAWLTEETFGKDLNYVEQ
ncbi:MAG: MFS transporter, partial [Sphingobacteriales bacterium]